MPVVATDQLSTVAAVSQANSCFIFFSQLAGAGMKRLCEDMVVRPPMRPSAFEAWVSAHCVDYAFGLYDAHEKALSVVRACVFACPTMTRSSDFRTSAR